MGFALFIGLQSFSASKAWQIVDIKTSAICDMCKTTIENTLIHQKGVRWADLNVETKIVSVKFNTKKNNIENLKQAIAAVGYDADEIVADPVAYAALHPCCKKGSKCDMPEGR